MKHLLLLISIMFASTAFAQTARVQVIHNSADAAAAEVDVYIDGGLAIDNFAFRTATAFLDLTADTPITIDIAPGNSTGVGDSIYNLTTTLASGETYIIVADGIVSPTGYTPAPAFDLEVFALGKEAAGDPANTEVLVHHGSTDAPIVDVVEVGVGAGTVVDNIAYTEFQGYLPLATADYALEVRDETGTVTVAAYELPLATLGLGGSAVTAVASGFLDPSVNSDGPAFGIFAALPAGGPLVALPISTARAQVIHNSADLGAAEVDVYINDVLAVDNFAFRTATPFIDLPSSVEIDIAIAPPTSSSSSEAIANFPFTLARNETYVVVADGIVSPTGYTPAPAFNLEVFPFGQEAAADPANTDVLVHHGSTDAPIVDVVEVGVGAGTVVDNIAYTEFQGYLPLATADYALEVRDETGTVTVAAYELPLATLGLDGAAVTAVASGFLDPSVNSDGPAFGIFAALPAGGPLVELPTSTARVQVIHNSGDAAAAEVDVYINDALAIDNFAYRTATPYLDLPAGVLLDIAIAPGNSTSSADAIANFPFTLDRAETYQVIANGIVSGSGYNPPQPFNLDVLANAREVAADPTQIDVMIHHGSTDAPTVDIFETEVGAGQIVDDISYSQFESAYLNLPEANYALEVTSSNGTVTLGAFELPIADLGIAGTAVTAVASGFLNPSNNSDGAAFGIFVALPTGGDLVELPTSTSRVQVIHNSADDAAQEVDVYLNDALAIDNFEFRTASPFLDIPAEVGVKIAIAPANSTSADEAIAVFPFNLVRNASYVVVADGIVSPTGYDPAPAFSLEVYDVAQEAANQPTNTDILVHHGSTDAPTVDVVEVLVGAGTIVDDLSYTDFQGYLEIPTEDYIVEVRDETGAVTVASYGAPLSTLGLDGAAIVVVASGFLEPANNSNGPAFGLWVALPSGGDLIPLPEESVLGVNGIAADSIVAYPNPINNELNIAGITGNYDVQVVDMQGRIIMEVNGLVNNSVINMETLASGIYQLMVMNGSDLLATQRVIKN